MLRTVLLLLTLSLAAPLLTGGTGEPRSVADPVPPTTLRFQVTNINHAGGTIWVGVYTSDDFMDRERARLVPVSIDAAGDRYIDIPDLSPGKRYALGLFHDLDDNGEFDTNWLGLPAEPWAFSGTLKSRLRLPRFEEVSFVFRPGITQERLRLRVWF